jgi:hypothetical protein
VCSHAGRVLACVWLGSQDSRSEYIIILNYLDECRNCKTADITLIIEVIRKRTPISTEWKTAIQHCFFLLPFINGVLLTLWVTYSITWQNDSYNSGCSTGNLTQDFLVQMQIWKLTGTKQRPLYRDTQQELRNAFRVCQSYYTEWRVLHVSCWEP